MKLSKKNNRVPSFQAFTSKYTKATDFRMAINSKSSPICIMNSGDTDQSMENAGKIKIFIINIGCYCQRLNWVGGISSFLNND